MLHKMCVSASYTEHHNNKIKVSSLRTHTQRTHNKNKHKTIQFKSLQFHFIRRFS